MIKSNIKKYLELSEITQKELAERVGTTEVSISRYVNCERIPKGPMCIKIAKILNCKVEDLYYETEDLKTAKMTENEAIKKLNMLDEALNFQRHDADECSCALQMAIQALEEIQQYRLAEEYKTIDVAELVEKFGQEKVQSNDGWIPCSERLPEPGKRYLVSGVWKDGDFEKHSVYDAVYGTDGIWHTYEYKPTMYDVIAYMPLPEPYREEFD